MYSVKTLVKVEFSDILNGEAFNPNMCPISVATKRAFPKLFTVNVDREHVTMWLNFDEEIQYDVGPKLAKWIHQYDRSWRITRWTLRPFWIMFDKKTKTVEID